MKKLFIGLTTLGVMILVGVMLFQSTNSVSAANQEKVTQIKQVEKTVSTVSNNVCYENHPNCDGTHKNNNAINTKQSTEAKKTVSSVSNTVCPNNHPNCNGIHENGKCSIDHTNCEHNTKHQNGSHNSTSKKHLNRHNGSKHH